MFKLLFESLSLLILLFGSIPISFYCARKSIQGHSSESAIARLLVFGVVWCFSETALSLLLGSLGLFNLGLALLSHALVFGVGMALLIYEKHAVPWALASFENFAKSKSLLTLLTFIFIFFGFNFWNLLVWPTVEVDSLGYHLPLLAKLIQTGKISYLNHFWFQEHFPRNWEMLCAFFALPIKSDLLLLCPNLGAQIIFGLSIICLSIKGGASYLRAIVAAFLLLSVPILTHHLMSMNVDVPFAAFVLSAFYFSFLFSESKSGFHFILILMSTALYLGIKSTGSLYLLVNVFLLVGLFVGKMNLLKFSSILNWKAARRILLSLLFLIPGFFWYAYNWLHFGNPLVGVEISLFGNILFPGKYTVSGLAQSSLMQVFDPMRLNDFRVFMQQILGQLSYPFLALLFFSLVFIGVSILKPKDFFKAAYKPALLAIAFITFLIYFKTPFSANYNASRDGLTEFVGQAFRFAFPCIGFIAVLGALGLEKLKMKDSLLLVISGAALLFAFHFQWKAVGLVIVACTLIYVVDFNLFSQMSSIIQPRLKLFLMVMAILLPVLLTSFLALANGVRAKNLSKRAYGPLVHFIDTELNHHEKIGYLNSEQSYNFCGSRFAHEVQYIPFEYSDFSKWIEILQGKGVQIIGIGPSSVDSLQKIRDHFLQYPEFVRPLFGASEKSAITLYEVGPFVP